MSELGSVYEFQNSIADAQEPIPLPTGEYRAGVQSAELAVSKSSGKPMLVLTHIVSPDQYPPDFADGNPDGEKLTVYVSLAETPRNRWNLKKLGEKYGVVIANRLDATAFIGQEVILNVEHEDYQGAPQARANPVRAV